MIFTALTPVLALIIAGFLLRRTDFLSPHFWPSAEKLTYYLLMPALLINSLANKQIGSLPWFELLVTVEGTVLASAVLVTLWWLVTRNIDGPTFTSLFQGGVRFNTFVALALAENLFGSEGLLIAALGAGFMIMLINVLCVTAFSAVTHSAEAKMGRIAVDLMKNPLIIGCVTGVGLNLTGIRLPAAIDGILALGGRAAFPLGLMAVGAAYRAGNLAANWEPLAVSSVVQFVCKPLIALGLAMAMGLPPMAVSVAVILFSVPTAPSAYILSRQMGGNYDAMASIITVQTILSFITLPIAIWLAV
jgi:hypothetical protein